MTGLLLWRLQSDKVRATRRQIREECVVLMQKGFIQFKKVYTNAYFAKLFGSEIQSDLPTEVVLVEFWLQLGPRIGQALPSTRAWLLLAPVIAPLVYSWLTIGTYFQGLYSQELT